MIKYYEYISTQKLPTVSAKLSWSHYDELLKFNNIDKINYYIIICGEQNLSIRKLREKIKNNEYERLPIKTKNKLIEKTESTVQDFIKNPIILKNTLDKEIENEKTLKLLILENMEEFLTELGTGFCFIKSEYKIKIGNNYNYIDLLLYNIKYKCYVVIELKVTELKKEHIGQIMTYMNYINENIKTIDENKTIGIIITKKDNRFIMQYCSDNNIFNTTYELQNS